MKCFNHTDREAVATCQRCGKGLCKECASKYTPCMCEECATALQQERQQQAISKEEQRKKKYKAALVDTRSEFIKTLVIGILLGAVLAFITVTGEAFDFFNVLFIFAVGLCAPFGWKLLTYIQSFFPVVIIGTLLFWILWLAVKIVISFYIGIPAFIFQAVKVFLVQKKINKIG